MILVSFLDLLFELYKLVILSPIFVALLTMFSFVAIVGIVKIMIRGYGNRGKLFKE